LICKLYGKLKIRRKLYEVFTHGQFYVGISRVTSMSRIKAIWNEEQREAKSHNIVYSNAS